MRKVLIYASVALVLASCDKVKELANININLDYKESVTIPSLPGNIDTLPPGGVSAYFPGVGVPTNSAKYMDQYKTGPNLINFVKLKKLSTTIQEPAGGNFDYIDSISVYLAANGLEKKLVAYKYGIPKGQSTIDLDCPGDVDLKEYFLKDTMYLEFGGHFVKVPTANSKIDLNYTMNMSANPLNK